MDCKVSSTSDRGMKDEKLNGKEGPMGKKRVLTVLMSLLFFIPFNCAQVIQDMGIIILTPKGNEVVKTETSYEIQWKTEVPESEFGKMVTVEVSKDGGKSWKNVEENVPNTGKYIWKVAKIESTQCKVRIYSQYRPKYRGTSDVFSVK